MKMIWIILFTMLVVVAMASSVSAITGTYYSNGTASGDGKIRVFDSGGWNAAHDAASGDNTYATDTTGDIQSVNILGLDQLERSYFPINTSSLPDSAVISSAKFCVYVTAKTNTDNDGDDFAVLVESKQGDANSLNVDDFNDCGDAVDDPTEWSNRIDIGAISTSDWLCFDLNGNGTNNISLTNLTMIGMREGHDVLDNPIESNTENSITYRTANYAGTTSDPYLNVTYTLASPNQVTIDINSTNGTNYTSQDLNCKFTPLDNSSSTMNASVWWYNNSVFITDLNTTNTSINNGSLYTATIGYGNTSHFQNWTCAVQFCNENNVCNDWANATNLEIDNGLPVVASATINDSTPIDGADLYCENGSVTDLDLDTVTLHYDWEKDSTWQGIDSINLSSDHTSANELWRCRIWGNDTYEKGANITSTSVSVGTAYEAPAINWTNASNYVTGVDATLNNPCNNDTRLNLSVQANDNNSGEEWTGYFCKDNSVGVGGCVGEAWCNSTINSSEMLLNCSISIGDLSSSSYDYYAFVVDNSSLITSSTKGTFHVNHYPEAATIENTDGLYINVNHTLLNWTATDADGDVVNYTFYITINTTSGFSFKYNGTTSEFNFTNATLNHTTYKWRIYTLDEHGYGSYNVTLGNFTTDFTKPNLTITSPEDGGTYTSQALNLEINASDFAIDYCNYTLYYKDTETIKDVSSSASCQGSSTLTVPYYTGGYRVDVFAVDKAGNINLTQLNFTTQDGGAGGGGGGGGGSVAKPAVELPEPKEQEFERCGDGTCDKGEDPLNCPQDCRLLSLDEMFCTPIFNCGNWKHAWFIYTIFIGVFLFVAYGQYKSGKIKRPI